jgi:three-Cys-motif partner protein
MTRSRYEWEPGAPSPIIQQHSIAKHEILRAYLSAYIRTLLSNPNRDEFRLVLIDGFAGGGTYQHADSHQTVLGSPFIMLEAAQEAAAIINAPRRNHVELDIDFFFIEKDVAAATCLRGALMERGYGPSIGKNVFVFNSEFEANVDPLIEHVRRKMPRSSRAIFLLDQYGYTDVPAEQIARIIRSLPGSEIILTFAVDALLNYFSENSTLSQRLLQKVGVPNVLRGRSFEDIKQNDKDWRLFVQSCLWQELVEQCQAHYYTLFFIRSSHGHGDYWLIHFSQRARARDVMTRIHWEQNNHFIHYGGPGLDMFHVLGYVSERDDGLTGQASMFEFDDVAKKASTHQLIAQLAPIIYADPDGKTFGELFATTCNGSPASSEIYKDAIDTLRSEKDIEVKSAKTGRSTAARIRDGDLIQAAAQRKLI